MVTNPARPSRFALEIENLPVDGWLVEVFLDDLSTPSQDLAGVLRLLVLAALHPPEAHQPAAGT